MQPASPSFVSVILSTYNATAWLEKTLHGYANQSHGEFELVIADDGSDEATSELIDRVRARTNLQILHRWHEDLGFRKCTILNRAIEAAAGDYLLFSDGDCIPRSDFVWQHYQAAERGRFLSGGYYRLPLALSQQISIADIETGRAFSPAWLIANGLPLSHRLLRLSARGNLAKVLNQITPTRATWNGNNASGWTADIVRANGFDERMRYGGEDRELGERLENAGVRGKHIRFQSVCLHLEHARGYVNDADWQRNHEIRAATRRDRRVRTGHGICKAA